MAKGKWIDLDEYYHALGYEVFGDNWSEDYINQTFANSNRDRKSDAFTKASQIKKLFYNRIWDDISDIQVMYRKEQGYGSVNFLIENWFIAKSECLDTEGYHRKCRIFLEDPETRGRKPLTDLQKNLIFSCVIETYPDANKKTEDINVNSVLACVVQKTQKYNEENHSKIKAPSYGSVSNYVRKKYPASKKKSRNSKN